MSILTHLRSGNQAGATESQLIDLAASAEQQSLSGSCTPIGARVALLLVQARAGMQAQIAPIGRMPELIESMKRGASCSG